jgi:ATP-dependent helicase HepA
MKMINHDYSSILRDALQDVHKNSVDFLFLANKEKLSPSAFDTSSIEDVLKYLFDHWFSFKSSMGIRLMDRLHIKKVHQILHHSSIQYLNPTTFFEDIEIVQAFFSSIGDLDNKEKYYRIAEQCKITHQNTLQTNVTSTEQENNDLKESNELRIDINTMVVLQNDPSKKGIVMDTYGTREEKLYKVFMDGNVREFYFSQIRPYMDQKKPKVHKLEDLFLYFTDILLKHPSSTHLLSFNAADIDFIPYQYKPVMKIVQSDQPRILIADGVGVGKTIEAGIILKELEARKQIQSVLIICPKPLVVDQKWYSEMIRFDEKFEHLDGKSFRMCLKECYRDEEWPKNKSKVILPYSLFDSTTVIGKSDRGNKSKTIGLYDLQTPPVFDLVIVDEAHHIRNRNSFMSKGVQVFCENANAVVFLTATPLQIRDQDLFVLLNTLRPDIIDSPETFHQMSEPNTFLNQALKAIHLNKTNWHEIVRENVEKTILTKWGQETIKKSLDYQQCKSLLDKPSEKLEEKVKLSKHLENMNTFRTIINRTRRSDVESFCIRNVQTIKVPFTPDQKRMYERILELRKGMINTKISTPNIGMIMSMIKRQLVSCVFGLEPFLKDIVHRTCSEQDWIDYELDEDQWMQSFEEFLSTAENIQNEMKTLEQYDPKLENLVKIIQEKYSSENNKVMIFSTFVYTLKYLYSKLKALDLRVGLMHGGTKDEERFSFSQRFKKPKDDPEAFDIMLFSEIGCEGLDFQFCNTMINYDIPWNPMRIEQRIGRIDRRGQKSDKVAIYNFITPDTIDSLIYERCLSRINIFEKSVGDCDKIIAETFQEITNVASDLKISEEEAKYRLEKIAENKIRLLKEQEELEKNQFELFQTIQTKDDLNKEIQSMHNFWLSEKPLQAYIEYYIKKRTEASQPFVHNTLKLSLSEKKELLRDYYQIPALTNPSYRFWEKWLNNVNHFCPYVFHPPKEGGDPTTLHITPLHPLARQAQKFFHKTPPFHVSFFCVTEMFPEGFYPFCLYYWDYKGLTSKMKFQAICTNEHLENEILNIFETIDNSCFIQQKIETQDIETLNRIHYQKWKEEKQQYKMDEEHIWSIKMQALETDLYNLRKTIHHHIKNTTNEKIIRMKKSELSRKEITYETKKEELLTKKNQVDIFYKLICQGVLEIRSGKKVY